jgi:hypothetical protein
MEYVLLLLCFSFPSCHPHPHSSKLPSTAIRLLIAQAAASPMSSRRVSSPHLVEAHCLSGRKGRHNEGDAILLMSIMWMSWPPLEPK